MPSLLELFPETPKPVALSPLTPVPSVVEPWTLIKVPVPKTPIFPLP